MTANVHRIPDNPNWMAYPYPWDDAPLDLSFLYRDEKPAGKHGFLKVEGDRFVFEDGTPARFWGTCFNSAANFPPHELAEQVARRLAKFGINMMRTHQLDAEWSTPNIFQFTKGSLSKDTLSFDPESLDRFDYLIHCLKQQGIYIYLDMLTYRRFKSGDGVDAAELLPRAGKPYANFDERMIELQKKYCHDLWTHVNPYTGLAYKDDPAVALTEFTNESDLCDPGALNPPVLEPYATRVKALFRKWARRNHVDIDVEKVDFSQKTEPVLRFLHDLQVEFHREMMDYLRSIDVKVPITGSNWTRGLTLLSALRNTDFTDTHPYWDMWSDVKGHNKMMLAEKLAPWPEKICQHRLLDRPMFISEWDSTWPNEWRGESPLMLAAFCAHQGLGGTTIHTYRYRYTPVDCMGAVVMDGVGYRVNFDTFIDPAKFGLFYHAALMFRRGDVAEAKQTAGVRITENMIFNDPWMKMPVVSPTAERHKIGLVLPGQKVMTDLTVDPTDALTPENAEDVLSDTGEICRSWARRISWIDTPRTKAAYGFLGEAGEIKLAGLTIKVDTRFAVIALSSLSDEPIEHSDNLLLTAVGRTDNTDATYNAEHTQRLELGHAPILVERIDAAIELKTDQPHLTVRAIDPQGFHKGTIPSTWEDGLMKFCIGKAFPSIYYLVQRISGVA